MMIEIMANILIVFSLSLLYFVMFDPINALRVHRLSKLFMILQFSLILHEIAC